MRQGKGWFWAWCALAACCATASAWVSLDVQFGWSGVYRAGRWVPIYVTLADDANPARNVQVHLICPHDPIQSMRVIQGLTISRKPGTFLMYAPLTHNLDDTFVAVHDSASRRHLGQVSLAASNGRLPYRVADETDVVVAIAGRNAMASLDNREIKWPAGNADRRSYRHAAKLMTAFAEVRFLPDAAMGYDAIDVLYLNSADLSRLGAPQQQAIAQWVRSGGRLIFWQGDHPLPPESPIAALLPCALGDLGTVSFSLEDTSRLQLQPRTDRIPARDLVPQRDATLVSLLAGKAQACLGRAGLGEAAVLSLDASQLTFTGEEHAMAFWRPILRHLVHPPEGDDGHIGAEQYGRGAAVEDIMDHLGNVPGVGSFNFTYVAIVLAAMMLLVGPIDWFVLKKLGRLPWTWITTATWIILLTVGALYLGHILRSGDLHYRTLRVVEQAGDQVVSVIDAACIYSPRTQEYALDCPRDAWWEPMAADPSGYHSTSNTEIPYTQDSHGTRPAPLTINIWNLRFMQGRAGDLRDEKPIIRAALQAKGNRRIVGAITNLGDSPLDNILIRTRSGRVALAESIAPGQTIAVDVAIDSNPATSIQREQVARISRRLDRGVARPLSAEALLDSACRLSPQQTRQVEHFVTEDDDLVVICAVAETATPVVRLNRPAIEKHCRIIRALVALK